jgi:hypothetical protein
VTSNTPSVLFRYDAIVCARRKLAYKVRRTPETLIRPRHVLYLILLLSMRTAASDPTLSKRPRKYMSRMPGRLQTT